MDTDAMTAEKNAMTAAKMANMTSVTMEDTERMNDMNAAAKDAMTAAKMQNYTQSDPEADTVIQQADERVGKPGAINAVTLYKPREIFCRCAFRRQRWQPQGTRHRRGSVTGAG